MIALSRIEMMEATRLTREGRVQEATALLQRGLFGRSDSADFNPQSDCGSFEDAPPLIARPRSPTAVDAGTPQAFAPAKNPSVPEIHNARPTLEIIRFPLSHRGKLSRQKPTARTDAFDGRAPETLPSRASFSTRAVRNAAGRRSYKIYVPSGYKKEKPLPLVVMLHGCTQSADDFAAGTRMNELAEELLFLVAYPEQTQGANTSKCWNWFKPGDQQRERGEPSLIADITRRIMHEFSVDPARVFVAGLSAGGAAAAIMGYEYPDLYRGVCVHSGLACGSAKDIPSAFTAMRNGGAPKGRIASSKSVPTIVFHGTGDKTVSPSNADHVIRQFKSGVRTITKVSQGRSAAGMDFTRTIETNEAGDALLERWTLHGAGHAWSGGSHKGSYTDPRGPDASREMMRFFLEPRLPA